MRAVWFWGGAGLVSEPAVILGGVVGCEVVLRRRVEGLLLGGRCLHGG